jgi:hypothetical protein
MQSQRIRSLTIVLGHENVLRMYFYSVVDIAPSVPECCGSYEKNDKDPFSGSKELDMSIQGAAKLTYSKSCREKSQESRKNKIKNIGGVFTKIYGSEGSNFSSCFLQIKNING